MYYIYMILSVVSDGFITARNYLINSARDIWKPVLMLPLIFMTFILLHIVFLMIISLFAGKKRKCVKMNSFFRWFSIQTLDIVMKVMRVRLHVDGAEMLPKNERFLLVGNHRSVFDPMIAMRTFCDRDVAFVSKKENMRIPFIGRLMAASGCISLDRENNRDAVKSIKQAAEYISENIASMGIYPEGKINKTEQVLLPFHSGSFKIAVKSNAPIVVTTMKNTQKVCRRFLFAGTDVYLNIVSIIRPEEYSSMKTAEVSKMVRDVMFEDLSENC